MLVFESKPVTYTPFIVNRRLLFLLGLDTYFLDGNQCSLDAFLFLPSNIKDNNNNQKEAYHDYPKCRHLTYTPTN